MSPAAKAIMWFKKLLVAVDFSPPSHEALRTATAMAADHGAELVLAHVAQPLMIGPELPAPALERETLKSIEADLERWKEEAIQAGARRASTVVITGTPWHELVELLKKDAGFDLAIVGTHGRTGLRHVLLGSVAERVVRHAPCPVLVVRAR